MRYKHINSKFSHLSFFINRDELFVWSKPKKHLYGFKGFAAAVFLYVDEFYDNYKGIFEYFDYVSKDDLEKVLINVLNIIEDTEEKEIEKIKKKPKLLKISEFKYRFFFSVENEKFLIEFNDESLFFILPFFKHLKCTDNNYDTVVSIVEFENGYEIYANKELIKTVKEKKAILPLLNDTLRLIHYQNEEFLIAMHSALLMKNDTALFLPGVSMSGKSTLCSYLAFKGFEVFSDELAVIDKEGFILPLPFGMTIKEGSWEIISQIKDLTNIMTHMRFDGQKVKVFSPPKTAFKKEKPKKYVFVFPKYDKNSSTVLSKLSVIEAVESFVKSGYHIVDADDFEKVSLWLKILSVSEIYSLTYSDIKEAYHVINGFF